LAGVGGCLPVPAPARAWLTNGSGETRVLAAPGA
jgi:hypothetical protein